MSRWRSTAGLCADYCLLAASVGLHLAFSEAGRKTQATLAFTLTAHPGPLDNIDIDVGIGIGVNSRQTKGASPTRFNGYGCIVSESVEDKKGSIGVCLSSLKRLEAV